MNRSLKIAQAFSKASETYDAHALIQKFTAQTLASKILSHGCPPLGTVLEVGCGTGTLSQHLFSHGNPYVLTDISFSLLQKAQEKAHGPHIFPLVVDGEHPCFTASFDLIVSNLALHWFQDPKKALTRLVACLKPGGKLYLTTLGNNTFHEWRSVHSLVEAPCGVLDFISFGQLKDWLPLSGVRQVEEEWITLKPLQALEFLRNLKGMGAHSPHPGHKPLSPQIFKKVMETYNQTPQVSFQILYATYQKPEKMREE